MKFFFSLLACALFLNSCSEKQDNKLTIATAANMQFAIKKIAHEFSKETGIDTDLIISSSGKLTSQIKAGAPFDFFVSADMSFPIDLYKSNKTDGEPTIYAYGKLVAWSMNNTEINSLSDITNSKIKHIAIANPKLAPYGIAAKEVLSFLKASNKVKIVYGESISQVNQFVVSKSVDIGLTSKSVVLSADYKGKGNWIDIPSTLHGPIAQGCVIIKRKNHSTEPSKKFHDFLYSPKAQEILTNFGYLINSK